MGSSELCGPGAVRTAESPVSAVPPEETERALCALSSAGPGRP